MHLQESQKQSATVLTFYTRYTDINDVHVMFRDYTLCE